MATCCPTCGYTPQVNEYDYCEPPGQFFELGVEAKRVDSIGWRGPSLDYEPIHGCPRCGVMFMDMGYIPNQQETK